MKSPRMQTTLQRIFFHRLPSSPQERQRNVLTGIRNNQVVYIPFAEAIKDDKPFDKSLIKVLNELSI